MGKGNNYKQPYFNNPRTQQAPQPIVVSSLLDSMEDNKEFASITGVSIVDFDAGIEIKRALKEISRIRKRPVICYIANVINTGLNVSTSIDTSDDLPFVEMIKSIPADQKNVDIILVTGGGSGERVAFFVNQIRNRFENVGFILPYMSMSAGTLFCLSGDEIIMSDNACIGPIDPQVRSKSGQYVPAQSIITLIDDIKLRGEEKLKKGQNPDWTDIQILNNLDAKEIGNAYNASKFSIELATEYIEKYKFKNWENHSSTGNSVTEAEKHIRAMEIADLLCKHSVWKSHSRGITREAARDICRLDITFPETVDGLDRAIRRFWALTHWLCERTSIYKMFVSDNYTIFKNVNVQ